MKASDLSTTAVSKFCLDIVRPLLRNLPRGSGTVYRVLGGYRLSPAWSRYGQHTTRGVAHGYQMRLDLSNCFERETYYLGRFYEWELEHLLAAVLRPGDTFIDVGANIGMVTLLGAARVGPTGLVLSFEPNPQAWSRLLEHIQDNELQNVRPFRVALGNSPGTALLGTNDIYSSGSSLRHATAQTHHNEVKVETLNSFVVQVPSTGRVLLKTDTEGFDFNVLKGASDLLSRRSLIVFSEVTPKWLAELDQTPQQMFDYMAGFGFKPYHVSLQNRRFERVMTIAPLVLPGPHHWFNALFLRDEDLAEIRDLELRH